MGMYSFVPAIRFHIHARINLPGNMEFGGDTDGGTDPGTDGVVVSGTDAVDPNDPPPQQINRPIYFYHPDHLGTSTFLTDFLGKAYQFFINLPFGETMAEQLPATYYKTPYKFTGKELDAETGMYYYGARYYDPKVSIWLSVDPLMEDFPSWSPYNYALNNPIRYNDPDGRGPGDVVAGFLAAVADYSFMGTSNFRQWAVTSDTHDYNRGLKMADLLTQAIGKTLIAKGTVDLVLSAGTAAGGLTTLVVPVIGEITCTAAEAAALTLAIEGLIEGAAGAGLYNMATNNIEKGNYAEESSGKKYDKEGIGSKNAKKGDKMGSNTKANKQIGDVAKKNNISDRKGFGKYIEKMKKAEGKGGADNYN